MNDKINHAVRGALHGRAGGNQGEVQAKLLLLEGNMLRLEFAKPLQWMDMTPAQAIALSKVLLDNAARLMP